MMHLQGIDPNTIKKMGCWSSDTFLMYIHDQISAFSKGVSYKMSTNISFHNIAFQPAAPPSVYKLQNGTVSLNASNDANNPKIKYLHPISLLLLIQYSICLTDYDTATTMAFVSITSRSALTTHSHRFVRTTLVRTLCKYSKQD